MRSWFAVINAVVVGTIFAFLEIGYLKTPPSCGQLCVTENFPMAISLEKNGALDFWDWIRRDDWGKGFFFLFLQNGVIAGLYALWVRMQRLSFDEKDSVDFINVSAELAKSKVAGFLKQLELQRESGGKTWRSAGEPPLGELYHEATQRLNRLDSDQRQESRVWKLAGKDYSNFDQYRNLVEMVRYHFQKFAGTKNISALEPLVQSAQENLQLFHNYEFELARGVPTPVISLHYA